MKYMILKPFRLYYVHMKIVGGWWTSESYTTRRAAVRGAKRAGGTEEVK
jgi:hypothetical protein